MINMATDINGRDDLATRPVSFQPVTGRAENSQPTPYGTA